MQNMKKRLGSNLLTMGLPKDETEISEINYFRIPYLSFRPCAFKNVTIFPLVLASSCKPITKDIKSLFINFHHNL